MKRTKIVCTIGPASNKPAILKKMIASGMNVARLNFSHGSYDDHARLVKTVRAMAKAMKTEVAILQDLQGPRIRIGNLPKEGVDAPNGSRVALVTEKIYDSGRKIPGYKVVPVQYDGLYKDVGPGNMILIEDGTKRLKVEKTEPGVIKCLVLAGGVIKNHKGINVPGVTLRAQVITEKDRADLAFGIKQNVDFVAISFVKDAGDIIELRNLIKKHAKRSDLLPGIIAKIEREEAVKNFDRILTVVDGIMVARGDLGIELPAARVPLLQKEFIAKCLVAAKPVIVATQMLDSMINNPLPTRAEVSDVANAVIDHTDAVMLSGETAAGKFPVEVVQTMANIVEETEKSHFDDLICGPFQVRNQGDALVQATCALETDIAARALVALTTSGKTARVMSRHRPELPIVAFTKYLPTQRQLCLSWGVYPHLLQTNGSLDHYVAKALHILKKGKIVKNRDKVVFVASYPFGRIPDPNLVMVQEVK